MIVGKKINLRLIRESDLEEYYRLRTKIEDYGEFQTPTLVPLVRIKEYFRKTGYWGPELGKLLVTDKEGKILGDISYSPIVSYIDGYNIGGQIFDPADRGKGFGSEALILFTDYLFKSEQINRLQMFFVEGNTTSQRVAEKCGYTYEGTMREVRYKKGKYKDMLIYSILRREYNDSPIYKEL